MQSHFQFSNQQRNGIFLLILLIVLLQCIYIFFDFSDSNNPSENEQIDAIMHELDSLRLVEQNKNSPKIYPFNPNYITDYKGYTLGMSNEEIDRLHQFRSKDKWVNSAKEFQEITKVSDSLLATMSPYFKFPEWVTNTKSKNNFVNYNTNKTITFEQKMDLNKATRSQLQKVYGVGEKLSERIINYRDKFSGGFHSEIELTEVYGLTPEVIENIMNEFAVKSPRKIQSFNLNTATRDELVLIKYIDYDVANNIIEERTLRDGFNTIEELTKVEDFPLSKIDYITLFLFIK